MTDESRPALNPSVTTWQMQRDAMLDQISYLEDCVNRTGEFLLRLEKEHPEFSFEIGETLLILFETKIDNDIRRGFDPHIEPVLTSSSTEKKEELV